MESRRTLGILVVAFILAIVFQGSDGFAVDPPFDSVLGPVVGIGVERTLRVVNGLLGASVVISSNPFAEVVGLDETFVLVEVVTRPFPVKFVLVIAHKHTARDQAGPRCSLKLDIYSTEHHVVLGPNIGCIISLDEGEVSAHIAAKNYVGIIREDPVARERSLLPEIDLVGLAEAWDWIGASFCILSASSFGWMSRYSREDGSQG